MGGWMGVASQKCVPWYQGDTAWQFTLLHASPPKLKKGPHKERIVFRHHFSRNLPNFTGVKLVTLEEFNNQQFPEGHWETLAIIYLPKPWHEPRPQSANRAKVLFGQDPPDQVLLLNAWNETGCPTKFQKKNKNVPPFFPWHHFPSCNQPVWKKMTKNISEPPKFGSHWAIFFNLLPRKKKTPKKPPPFFGQKFLRGTWSWHRAVVFPRGDFHPPMRRSGCGCARRRRQGPQGLDGQSGKSGCFC